MRNEWIQEQGIHWGFGRGAVDAEKAKLGDHGREAVERMDSKGQLGIFKNPRLCLTLPAWMEPFPKLACGGGPI
jgi:hypothetical protein